MIAKVHVLFPGQTAAPGEAPAAELAHPFAIELRNAVLGALDELLRRMFDSADDFLFEMGEKSGNDSERRRYFDTMRVLRLDRSKVARGFAEGVASGFLPTGSGSAPVSREFDLDSLSIQPTEELEEKIALANMAAKAEGLYKNQIFDIERRLETAVRERGVGISTRALAPVRMCEAFGSGIAALGTDFQIKLVIYKLFERTVIQDLGRVYQIALDLMTRHNMLADPTAAARRSGSPSHTAAGPAVAAGHAAAPAAAGASAGAGEAYAGGAAQLQDLLRLYGLDPATLQRSTNPLAAEFSGLLQALQGGGPSAAAIQASTQRLSLAGRMFEDLLAEPLLPDPLRPAIEKLRYPVYRSALTDSSFFNNPLHPLRKLLSDLVELSVSAQSSDIAQQQLREVLRSAAALHSDGPGLAAEALRAAQPVSEHEVDEFLQQMQEQTRARRDGLLMRVRRLVAQELEVQTLGREIPSPVMRLLRGGVGPLMAVRLLKNGRASTPYRDAQSLIERILDSLEFVPPATADELHSREQLTSAILSSLADIGMEDDKIEGLLNGLQEVYRLLDRIDTDTPAETGALSAREERLLKSEFSQEAVRSGAGAPQAPAPAPTPSVRQPRAAEPSTTQPGRVMELLRRVLLPDAWFRVFHAELNQTRWLKLHSFYPERDAITFTGFDETQKLNLRAMRFAEDLARGHSEPINPDEDARNAVDQLREAKAQGLL